MTKSVIPLQQIPNQHLIVELDGQQCEFDFITRGLFMYMNLTVDGNVIIDGQICQNNTNLIQYQYLKFSGSLYFTDTQGELDPLYYGLNDRWLLIYEDESV